MKLAEDEQVKMLNLNAGVQTWKKNPIFTAQTNCHVLNVTYGGSTSRQLRWENGECKPNHARKSVRKTKKIMESLWGDAVSYLAFNWLLCVFTQHKRRWDLKGLWDSVSASNDNDCNLFWARNAGTRVNLVWKCVSKEIFMALLAGFRML